MRSAAAIVLLCLGWVGLCVCRACASVFRLPRGRREASSSTRPPRGVVRPKRRKRRTHALAARRHHRPATPQLAVAGGGDAARARVVSCDAARVLVLLLRRSCHPPRRAPRGDARRRNSAEDFSEERPHAFGWAIRTNDPPPRSRPLDTAARHTLRIAPPPHSRDDPIVFFCFIAVPIRS